MTRRPFDPGLQLERSELAWRRTCLSVALTAVVAMRLLPAALHDGRWIIVGAIGTVLSAVAWMLAGRRCRRIGTALVDSGLRARLPGGLLLALVAIAVALVGGCGAALAITAAG